MKYILPSGSLREYTRDEMRAVLDWLHERYNGYTKLDRFTDGLIDLTRPKWELTKTERVISESQFRQDTKRT